MKHLILEVLAGERMPPTVAIALHSQKNNVKIALLHDTTFKRSCHRQNVTTTHLVKTQL